MQRQVLSLFALLLLAPSAMTLAQTARIGPKETRPTGEVAGGSELDHMGQLITRLKLTVGKIQDPEAKKAALIEVDLWQHLLDHLIRENGSANNSGAEHHHEQGNAPAALKQSPKPQ
jgi:hypothetical protein